VTPSPVKPVTHVQVYEPYMEKNKKVTVNIVACTVQIRAFSTAYKHECGVAVNEIG